MEVFVKKYVGFSHDLLSQEYTPPPIKIINKSLKWVKKKKEKFLKM